MKFSPQNKEWLIIGGAWSLIFASAPLYMYYALVSIQSEFKWSEVVELWGYISAFLLLFLIHHFILIPHLFEKRRLSIYLLSLVALFAAFISVQMMVRPEYVPKMRDFNAPPVRENVPPPPMAPGHDDLQPGMFPPEPKPMGPVVGNPRPENPVRTPLLPPPDLARLVIALLMIGVDLGVVAWFKQQKMQQRMLMLEQQNLKQELDHLRYQINPHFFMNTLNNIHALVDIDHEQAQRAIIELSGLMRYALYEGSGSMTPLQHEIEFMNHYIALMRLRFGNKVRIDYEVPETVPADIQVPPLIFVSFMENAFKHGVSYKEESFVYISLNINMDTRELHFCCENSKHNQGVSTHDGHHGIGLENVRKRLELIYADKVYDLKIDESDSDTFLISLIIPV